MTLKVSISAFALLTHERFLRAHNVNVSQGNVTAVNQMIYLEGDATLPLHKEKE